MYNRFIKPILTLSLAAVLFAAAILPSDVKAFEELAGARTADKTVICIDPGHGGETDGATYEYYGVTVKEKEVNLAIALKLREELEKYENVEIVMTRTADVTMEIDPRVEYALEQGADYLISVHNNAAGGEDRTKNGCMVLSTVSQYQAPGAQNPDIYGISEKLSLAIVERLTRLGIPLATELGAQVDGVVKRPYSPQGQARSTMYYPDGSVADYYGLIRSSVKAGLPAIIIEHAYLSNAQDYRNYLRTDDALAALARADAEGIAEALGLTKKPEQQTADRTAGQLQRILYALPWKTMER